MKGVKDALARLSGVKTVTVKLQEGWVIASTDPGEPVLPAALWKEIARVGFKPAAMELRARGLVEGDAFVIDVKHWPLARPVASWKDPRTLRLKVVQGAEDPPLVELIE